MFFIKIAVTFIFIQYICFAQGELDNSFGSGGKVITNIFNTDDYGTSSVIQQDGKIIVAGFSYDGPSSDANFAMVRYNTDGILDDSFGFGGKVTTDFTKSQDIATSVAIQNDGKIIIAGNTDNQTMAAVRYKSNGIIDSTFGTAGKATLSFLSAGVGVGSVAIQSDQKIVLGGYAYSNFHFNITLVRFNTNGTLDNTFNVIGSVTLDLGNYSEIYSVKIESDQKIIAAGSLFNNNGNNDFIVARYNPDGSLDNTFNSVGTVITDFGNSNDAANSIIELPDGKLCVAGSSFNGINNDFALVEYNSDGSLNNSFGSFGKVKTDINNSEDNGNSILMQTDGKLIISGTTYNGANHDFAVVRYNSNGTLDDNFGTAGKVVTDFNNSDDNAGSSAIQSDGKIVVAGYTNGLYTDFAAVRYNTDGAIDNSFGTNGIVKTDLGNSYDTGNSLVIQKNGKIVVAGSANNGASYDVAVTRYNIDGSLDNTFGDRGKANTNLGAGTNGNSAAIQSNGKIVVAGSYNSGANSDFLVLRYDTTGQSDNTFGQGGISITDFGNPNDYGSAVAIQSDGRIIVAGSSGIDFAVARYNTDGSPDNTFATGGKTTADFGNSDDIGSSVIVQKDGKIIVAGSSSNGINYDFAMVRFNSNGTIDNTFGSNGKVKTEIQNSEDFESSILIQPDSKIILVGYSSIMGGNYNLSMVRYNSDGTIDNSFGTDGKVITDLGTSYGYSNSAVLQPDGRIDVTWNLYNGKNTDFVIVRYNNNGSLDDTFGSSGIVAVDFDNSNDLGSSIALQSDGKIVAAGSSNNGFSSDFAVLRYNSLYPVVQVSSLSLQFGNVFIDSTSAKSFYIKNTGSSLLRVDSIINKNKVFTLDQNSFSLAPGDSQKINITFKPIQAQVYNEKLIIYHNAAGNPDTLNISGNGMVKTAAVISLSTTAIDFGAITVSKNSQKSFYVKNIGTASLVVDSITSDKNVYSVSIKNFTLALGDSQEVKVTFTPTDTVVFNGKISVFHIASGSPSIINLTGTGTSKATAILSLSATKIDFGQVTINNNLQKSILVRNTGTATLVIDSITINNKTVFSVSPAKFNVLPGDSTEVKVTFTPKDTVAFSGNLSIFHNASGSPNIINLTGTGTSKAMAIISLSATKIDFGRVTVNNNLQKSILVKNTGTATLVIDSLTINNKTVFSVTPTKFNVLPGDSAEVKVTFTPKDTVAFSGNLSIFHNSTGSPNIINLTGTGTSKTMAIINLSESAISFGLVTINSKSQKSFFVKNKGTATLNVDSMTINNGTFSIDSTKFSVAPGDSQEVKVTFTPKDTVTNNATLNIYHNADGSPSAISLSGKGTLQKIPIIILSKEALNFGEVTVNNSSEQTFSIKNTGTADLLIDSIKSNNNIFITSAQNFIIKPDSNKDVTVTFSPKDTITYSGMLSIYNNTSGNPGIISLSGKGVSSARAIINISSNSLSFGNVVKDSSKTLQLNIKNTGKADLKVDSIKSSSNVFIINFDSFIVKPDSNRDVSVSFIPKDSIAYNGTLNIYHNASGNLSTVSLSGRGITAPKAIINISSSSLSFGDVIKGNSTTLNFNIKNSGNADLKIDSIRINSSSFTAVPTNFNLKPESSQSISVTFTPQDSATYNAILNIYYNLSGSPSTISISGNGFIYPSILSVNQSVSFGDVNNINNYKIIGIPGNSNIAVSSITQGDYQYDWNVYDDNGNTQDYLVTNSNLKFTPGKAYWILGSKTLNINQQITPVQLNNADNTYSIPLHSGWNLISNPFEKNLTWQNVQNLNGLPANSVLYFWSGSNWNNPFVMAPYAGYYFNNTGNLTTLKLHYESHQSAGKISKEKTSIIDAQKFLELSVTCKNLNQTSAVLVGIDSLSNEGIDSYDYYSPPADFQNVRISLMRNELPAREKYLFIEQRPEIKEGQSYNLEIKTVPNEPINISTKGIENFKNFKVYLFDERLKNLYNLQEENSIKLNLAHQYNNFKLFIGTNEYIEQIKQGLNLIGYQLYQNYPNPFNPSTVIRFSIPKQGNVTMKIYNILGQIVRTIINNEIYEAGTHEIVFSGSRLASGVYVISLESANFSMQKKMVLIK